MNDGHQARELFDVQAQTSVEKCGRGHSISGRMAVQLGLDDNAVVLIDVMAMLARGGVAE